MPLLMYGIAVGGWQVMGNEDVVVCCGWMSGCMMGMVGWCMDSVGSVVGV